MRPREMDRPQWLTVAEAAALLGLHRMTVYDHCARGWLPCRHFGRAIRIPRAAVEPQT